MTLCMQELAVGGGEWVGHVSSGLRDILTSQLDCVHREPALYLAALLCQLFTLEWVAPAGSKFMLLLVNLFKVVSLNSTVACACLVASYKTLLNSMPTCTWIGTSTPTGYL